MNINENLVAMLAIFCIFGLPMFVGIISMLLKHQREMAQLLRSQSGGDSELLEEIRKLRAEVEALKARTEAMLFEISHPSLSSAQETQDITRPGSL